MLSWYGNDVYSPFGARSVGAPAVGTAGVCIHEECPQAAIGAIALEFGTVPFWPMLEALRAEQWLAGHPAAPAEMHEAIRRKMRDAFYIDSNEWRGMVAVQTRAAVLQACNGLAG